MVYLKIKPLRVPSYVSDLFQSPFLILLFLYFLTVSFDLFNFQCLIFKVKLNNFLSVFVSVFLGVIYKRFRLSNNLDVAALGIFISIIFSLLGTANVIACLGLASLFLFNYFFNFLFPINLFLHLNAEKLINLYFLSFWVVGVYAVCQVLFSFTDIILPGVTQWVESVARGQGLSYEPSFYALYMTPFAIFQSTKFLLSSKSNRSLISMVFANLFLIFSTSTGCLLSYIFYIGCLFFFKSVCKYFDAPVSRLALNFFIAVISFFLLMWIIDKDVIIKGLMKFFFNEQIGHHSVQLRWGPLVECWDLFLDHPVFGIGLGSIPSHLAKKKISGDLDPLDPSIMDLFAPMNVATEILASLGLVGLFAFLFFFYSIWKSFKSTLKIKNLEMHERINLISFLISVCVMFFTMQFSQSILRPYNWLHFAISIGYVSYIKLKYRENQLDYQRCLINSMVRTRN